MKLKLDKYNPHRQSLCVLGMSQTGKTRISKIITKLIVDSGRKAIVYDPNHRWTQKVNDEPVFSASYVVNTIHEMNPKGLCIVQPVEDSENFFVDFCKKVWSFRQIGFFTVIIDELHNNVTTFHAKESFKMLVRNCHNWNIGYVAIMQRTQEVPKMTISNSMHQIAFRLNWPSDIKILKEFLGEEVERLSPDSENPLPENHAFYKAPFKKVIEVEP